MHWKPYSPVGPCNFWPYCQGILHAQKFSSPHRKSHPRQRLLLASKIASLVLIPPQRTFLSLEGELSFIPLSLLYASIIYRHQCFPLFFLLLGYLALKSLWKTLFHRPLEVCSIWSKVPAILGSSSHFATFCRLAVLLYHETTIFTRQPKAYPEFHFGQLCWYFSILLTVFRSWWTAHGLFLCKSSRNLRYFVPKCDKESLSHEYSIACGKRW